ncbi:MAG: sugar ABC transporter ATP-binding protein, partial [Acetobacteraceae bacterium]
TAGVDVGAKVEIYGLFEEALAREAAIIIVSTDFEEIAKVCHRAIVFDHGAVASELSTVELSIANLLAAASASLAGSSVAEPATA